MGLFRRKTNLDPEPERCPLCSERVPEGVDECNMCGADLRALRPSAGRAAREPAERT